jgi:acetate kinase
MNLLTVNTGSSSVRLAAFDRECRLLADARNPYIAGESAVAELRLFLDKQNLIDIGLVVHRVVHGGRTLTRPCLIDRKVETEIRRLIPLAPLHNPRALAWIDACRDVMGDGLPQIAVFDTAFYADLPEAAASYALPRGLCEQHGLRRYGFHGLAHQAMWEYWRERQPRSATARVISLQLGAGCSASAVVDGKPRDTSMGFSPLEGLMMATRCGDIDPGLLLYLQKSEQPNPAGLERLLNEASGLLGVSGLSGDMRVLLESDHPDARRAIDLYCYRARKYIGAYMAALGGADAILFGGGVGENAPSIRAQILQGMEWCGIRLDPCRNDAPRTADGRINAGSGVQVWTVPVNEAALLAHAGLQLRDRARGYPEVSA